MNRSLLGRSRSGSHAQERGLEPLRPAVHAGRQHGALDLLSRVDPRSAVSLRSGDRSAFLHGILQLAQSAAPCVMLGKVLGNTHSHAGCRARLVACEVQLDSEHLDTQGLNEDRLLAVLDVCQEVRAGSWVKTENVLGRRKAGG